ncbi:MAG: hypothetical protein RI565_10710 [Schleiferiaceae bacterium]|nr:hypothetical protein [Schleiferiaceae bacterium]
MILQYIIDDKGKTTGVFIPIQEWNNLKAKYEGIEDEADNILERQKEVVRERIQNTRPEEYQSWEDVRQQLKFD